MTVFRSLISGFSALMVFALGGFVQSPAQAQSTDLLNDYLADGNWEVVYGVDTPIGEETRVNTLKKQAVACIQTDDPACFAGLGQSVDTLIGFPLRAGGTGSAPVTLTEEQIGRAFANTLFGDEPMRIDDLEIELGVVPVQDFTDYSFERPVLESYDCSNALIAAKCVDTRDKTVSGFVTDEPVLRSYIRTREFE